VIASPLLMRLDRRSGGARRIHSTAAECFGMDPLDVHIWHVTLCVAVDAMPCCPCVLQVPTPPACFSALASARAGSWVGGCRWSAWARGRVCWPRR
jgi:hypothetical protein